MAKSGERYSTMELSVRKFGWKRVAKNFCRFGWETVGAEERTEITETPCHDHKEYETQEAYVIEDVYYTKRETKVRVWLSFVRFPDRFANLGAIKPLELLFDLVFLVRRILGFLLPLAALAAAVMTVIENAGGGEYQYAFPLIGGVLAGAFVWLLLNVAEVVIARIASRILKVKA